MAACWLQEAQTGFWPYFFMSLSSWSAVGWYALCRELGLEGRLFYRHRPVNLNFKSGNVADFLRRWGADYRYMVVLDADSVMGGDTLVRMVRHAWAFRGYIHV